MLDHRRHRNPEAAARSSIYVFTQTLLATHPEISVIK
jgi:hypothetical protein